MDAFPAELWLKALKRANSKPVVWATNYVAFNAGREIGLAQCVVA
jgi:indolepyruvate ferredoxin oxidoreductase, alpha subunit